MLTYTTQVEIRHTL